MNHHRQSLAALARHVLEVARDARTARRPSGAELVHSVAELAETVFGADMPPELAELIRLNFVEIAQEPGAPPIPRVTDAALRPENVRTVHALTERYLEKTENRRVVDG